MIAGLAIIFIVFFSIPGDIVGRKALEIGKVDGEGIDAGQRSEFVQQYQRMIAGLRERQTEISPSVEQYARQQAFLYVVHQILTRNFALDSGFFTSDRELVDFIKQSFFTDSETGEFLSSRYEQFQRQGKLQDKLHIENVARDRLLSFLVYQTLFTFAPVTRYELSSRLETEQYQKKLEVAYLSLEDHFDEELTEKEIEDYYTRNSSNYPGKPFPEVREIVEADYLNKHIDSIEGRVKTRYYSILLQSLSNFDAHFTQTTRKMKMEHLFTDFIHYYKEEVRDTSGELIPLLSSPDFIQNALTETMDEKAHLIEMKSILVVVRAVKTKRPESIRITNSTFSLDDQKRKELEKKRLESLMYLFRDNLYKRSRVENNL